MLNPLHEKNLVPEACSEFYSYRTVDYNFKQDFSVCDVQKPGGFNRRFLDDFSDRIAHGPDYFELSFVFANITHLSFTGQSAF